MKTLKDFEKFISFNKRSNPFISIRQNGQIAFSMGAVNKYHLDKFKYVILWISKDGLTVAIQFTNDHNEDGAIIIQKRPGNFSFSAGAFLNLNDIPSLKTKSFKFMWNPEDNVAFFHPKAVDALSNNIKSANKNRKSYSFNKKVSHLQS